MVRGAELIGDSLDLKETGEHSEEFTKGTKRPIISAGFSPPASFLRASMSALRERTSDLTSAHPFAKHRKSDAKVGMLKGTGSASVAVASFVFRTTVKRNLFIEGL